MAIPPRLSQTGPLPEYSEPSKRIHDGPDVQFFLQSTAYRDITIFILQLNRSLIPRKRSSDGSIRQFRLNEICQEDLSSNVVSIQSLMSTLAALLKEAPPDTGPRRFGNVSFRTWYNLVEQQTTSLLKEALPESLHPAIVELKGYFLGGFGSAQRLDYGTGHELSYLAFLACLWKLGYFNSSPDGESQEATTNIERQIVLVLFVPYLDLIRNLIITYNLEPAGSHGVWGLDDNSFLPYMFGSAQLCPPLPDPDSDPPTPTPTSGSLPSSPDPSIVTKASLVDKEAPSNLYFGAIKFIHTVKRGPFWEHSPMLFDISGIKDGWGKISKGMIKMYDAEVLAKFPVVQHFPFGNLLRWEKDPESKPPVQTTHQSSQPLRDPTSGGGSMNATGMRPPAPGVPGTAAPWAMGGAPATRAPAAPKGFVNGVTQAPWARSSPAPPPSTTVNSPGMPSPSTSRQPPPQARPLHSQASQPSTRPSYARQSLREEDGRPVSAATKNEEPLKEKVAETIPEGQATD